MDCGIFAIAFAVAICSGKNPEELQFGTSCVMRQHLYMALEKKEISMFPAVKIKESQQTTRSNKTEEVEVFCKCRLQESGKMIYCEGCGEWWHGNCEKIPKKAWGDAKWLCKSCV